MVDRDFVEGGATSICYYTTVCTVRNSVLIFALGPDDPVYVMACMTGFKKNQFGGITLIPQDSYIIITDMVKWSVVCNTAVITKTNDAPITIMPGTVDRVYTTGDLESVQDTFKMTVNSPDNVPKGMAS
jgi:hypothetical protein